MELDQQRIDHDEIADGQCARDHTLCRHIHARGETNAEDQGLTGIKHTQGMERPDGGILIFFHRGVEAPLFQSLIAEIFYRLKIEQAVHRFRIGFGVRIIPVAPDRNAPFARFEGKPDINHNGHHHDNHELPTKIIGHHRRDESGLEDGRYRIQDRHSDNQLDRPDAAFDNPAQSPGLALQMKAQR